MVNFLSCSAYETCLLFIFFWMGSVPFQRPLNCCWNLRNMRPLWLKSILIGNILYRNWDSIRTCVLIRALNVYRVRINEVTFFLSSDSITGFIAGSSFNLIYKNPTICKHLHFYCIYIWLVFK